jgi:hypothetical protein
MSLNRYDDAGRWRILGDAAREQRLRIYLQASQSAASRAIGVESSCASSSRSITRFSDGLDLPLIVDNYATHKTHKTYT